VALFQNRISKFWKIGEKDKGRHSEKNPVISVFIFFQTFFLYSKTEPKLQFIVKKWRKNIETPWCYSYLYRRFWGLADSDLEEEDPKIKNTTSSFLFFIIWIFYWILYVVRNPHGFFFFEKKWKLFMLDFLQKKKFESKILS
jgi:hypothetical protein